MGSLPEGVPMSLKVPENPTENCCSGLLSQASFVPWHSLLA